MVCDSALYSQENIQLISNLKWITRVPMTLLFIMSLCLLVYNLGQRELRNTLKRTNNGVRNQLGKLTNTPTLRWIFQCFQGVHLLTIERSQKVVNLTEERSESLRIFTLFLSKILSVMRFG